MPVMEMSMQMPTATATASISSTAMHMPSMAAMDGMSSVFSVSTNVTLFFTGWTTKSGAAYFGTVVFLFVLAVFNRFQTALKQQLEMKWSHLDEQLRLDAHQLLPDKHRYHHDHHSSDNSPRQHDPRRHSRAKSLQYGDTASNNAQSTEPLSPPPYSGDQLQHQQQQEDERDSRRWLRAWKPSERWSWKRNTLRSFMELTRSFTGYVLMLAVMTFNVGFFFAVLAGISIGEFFLGRYSKGAGTLQEGGCHE